MFKRGRKELRGLIAVCAIVAVAAVTPAVAQEIADYARNAGKVGGLRPASLARASLGRRQSHIEDFASSGWTTVHGVSAHAPARGIFLVWGQFSAEWDDDSDPGTYASVAARVTIDDKTVGQPQFFEIDRVTKTGTLPVSLSGAIPVEAGAHRVRIQVRRRDGSALTHLFPRQTQTLFVPFGDSGEQGKLY